MTWFQLIILILLSLLVIAVLVVVTVLIMRYRKQNPSAKNKTTDLQMPTNLQMPKTETPLSVFFWLLVLAILGGSLLYTLFELLGVGFLGVILWLVIIGLARNSYTEDVPGFHARILINQFTSKQRTISQGLHLTLPWEDPVQDIDLRVDLKEETEETYTTLDGRMDTGYVCTFRPDFPGEGWGDRVILYASYEGDAIKQEGLACLSMSFSDYFGKRSNKDLLDKEKINREVFKDLEGQDPAGKQLVQEFREKHGTRVTVRMKDSDFDAATQAARDALSRAKSFTEAVEILMTPDKNGDKIERPEAEKIAKMMNLPGVQEYIVSFNATGVDNLRDVTLLPGSLGGGGKK